MDTFLIFSSFVVFFFLQKRYESLFRGEPRWEILNRMLELLINEMGAGYGFFGRLLEKEEEEGKEGEEGEEGKEEQGGEEGKEGKEGEEGEEGDGGDSKNNCENQSWWEGRKKGQERVVRTAVIKVLSYTNIAWTPELQVFFFSFSFFFFFFNLFSFQFIFF